MRRYNDSRNEFGGKNTVQIKIDGITIQRLFRSRGEAIAYLQRKEGFTKSDITRRVRFV
jgi:NAD-dependent DNA ligase